MAYGQTDEIVELRREIAEAHDYLDEALAEGQNPETRSLVKRIGKLEAQGGLTIATLMAEVRRLRRIVGVEGLGDAESGRDHRGYALRVS